MRRWEGRRYKTGGRGLSIIGSLGACRRGSSLKKRAFTLALVAGLGCTYWVQTAIQAQTATPAAPPAAQARPGLVAYPDRPKAPPDVIDRGKGLYSVNCSFCHGSDAGGGAVGPNLWRSSVVLQDQKGELIMPIVHGARADRGMPSVPINDAQISDIAAWLHSIHIASRTDPNAEKINIVTGNAPAGKVYFDKTCASCHSTADMTAFVKNFPDPKQMQQAWLLPGGPGGRGGAPVVDPRQHVPPTGVVVTMNGKRIEGVLSRIDDFSVSLTEKDGTYRTFAREGDKPKVEVIDPVAPHRKLMPTYTDKDIHDLTAYLVTLK